MFRYRQIYVYGVHLALAMPCASTAHGKDIYALPIEALPQLSVQSVGFFETSLSRSPNNVRVITHRDIDNSPALALSDFIDLYVPGVHLARQAAHGHQFGARGITRAGAPKTLVMWDGQSLNQKGNLGNLSVYSSQLLGDVEQVEIVLGPGSLMHGSGAVNGFVNFVPKTGVDHQGLNTRLDLGLRDDLVKMQLGYGHAGSEDRHLYLYGGIVQADGFGYGSDFGGATGNVAASRNALLNIEGDPVFEYRPSYKLSANWAYDRFNLKVLYDHQEADTNSAVQFQEPFAQKTILSLQPRATLPLGDSDTLEIAPSLIWIDKSILLEARTPADTSNEGGGSESGIEVRTTYQTGRFRRQDLAVGFSVAYRDTRSLRHFFSSDPDLNTTHVDGDWVEYALFAEDRIQLGDGTWLTLGARQDWADFDEISSSIERFPKITFTPDDISNLSLRAALTHEFNERHTLRISYQEGFLYPLLVRFPRTEAITRVLREFGLEPLPSLRTESVDSFEAGLNSIFLGGDLDTRLTLYYNRYNNLAGFRDIRVPPFVIPEEVLAQIPENLPGITISSRDDFASVGGELSVLWHLSPYLRASLGYAYSVPSGLSEQANTELAIANESRSEWSVYPKHQAKAELSYNSNKWSMAVAAVYESEVDTDETRGGRPIFDDNYTRVNAIVQHHVLDNLSIFAIGKNIFNDGTPPLNSAPSQPWAGTLGSDARLFYIGVKWRPHYLH